MGSMLYKLLSMAIGLLGGVVAGAVYKQLWKWISGEEEAPDPTDPDHTWREVFPAAVLRGAVVGGVRAAIERGGAQGVRRLTGHWPTND